MRCYIIFKSGGCYSDYWDSPIVAYDDENLAKCKLAELNGTLKEWKKKVFSKIQFLSNYNEMAQVTREITGGAFNDHFELEKANDYFITKCEFVLKNWKEYKK